MYGQRWVGPAEAAMEEPRTAMDIIAVLGSVVVVVIGLGLVLGFVLFFFAR